MKSTIAKRMEKSLITVRDEYYKKHTGEPYSQTALTGAVGYLSASLVHILATGNEYEREFLTYCIDTLKTLIDEGDDAKVSRFANAIRAVPLIFTGDKKWNREFRKEYLQPFCDKYGDEYFALLKDVELPADIFPKKQKPTYHYDGSFGKINILVMLCGPVLLLCVLAITMLIVHLADYTDDRRGERFELTVESYSLDSDLILYCEGFDLPFKANDFAVLSNEPDKLIDLCDAGEPLVIHAKYKKYEKYPRYEIVSIDDTAGNVYRTVEQTNRTDEVLLKHLGIGWVVFAVPTAALAAYMVYVVKHPQKFQNSRSWLLRLCFVDVSIRRKR